MDSTGITPVFPMGNDNGWGGNGFMGIFGLLILLALIGGNGFGFGGNNNTNALQGDMQRGFDNQNTMAQTRDILSAVTGGTAQSVAATNQVYHDIVGNLGDKYMELARDVAGVQNSVQQAIANQNECCCGTKLLISESTAGLSAQIAQNKYENALALAGMEARLTAKMDQDVITSLRGKIQQLELNQAMCGVIRYPMGWSYNAGVFPPVTSTGTAGA